MKYVTVLLLGLLGIAGPAFADDNTLENAVGGGVGGAAGAGEIFVITSGSGAAQSTIDLSWIRIYADTTDFNAPLSSIPEVSSMGYLAFASLLGLVAYRRRCIRK